MSLPSTVFSQTINIPLETKREIVKTLEAYPLALDEIDLLEEIVDEQQEIIAFLNSKVKTKDDIIGKKDEIIDLLIEESNIYAKKLEPPTFSMFLYGKAPFDFAQPEIGIQLHIKDKMFISGAAQYSELKQKADFVIGLGVKLF